LGIISTSPGFLSYVSNFMVQLSPSEMRLEAFRGQSLTYLTVVHPKLNNNVIKLVICIPQDKIRDSWNPQISAPLTPKRENCFAILISVCNFHISFQFSDQFAILTFQCIVPTFVNVCNFHMSLQFSYEFAIFISVCNSLQHLLTLLCMDSLSL
jgi:hypothetical protein